MAAAARGNIVCPSVGLLSLCVLLCMPINHQVQTTPLVERRNSVVLCSVMLFSEVMFSHCFGSLAG